LAGGEVVVFSGVALLLLLLLIAGAASGQCSLQFGSQSAARRS